MQSQQTLLENILSILSVEVSSITPEMQEKINLLATDFDASSDILNYIEHIARITGKLQSPALEDFMDEINIIIHKLKFISKEDRPKVICIELDDYLSVIKSAYLLDSIALTGGNPLEAKSTEVDRIIVIDRHQQAFSKLPSILADPILAHSPAIEKNQVYIINKADFGNCPGKDYLQELEILAEIIQPKYFIFGHEGASWLKFELA